MGMLAGIRAHALVGAAAALALCTSLPAAAQKQPIRIGLIHDYTGPFAGGGSEPAAIGAKLLIDKINKEGGVEGHMIEAVYADAQSKVDVAINEAERLLNQEKVDLIMGVYSSAQCVPLAQKMDGQKAFMWANICISSAVFKGRNLQYVFRPQAHSDQFGEVSVDMIAHYAKAKLGEDVKGLKVAIIHEDGPYGVGVASSNESQAKKHGMEVVLKEGYSATAPDLSSLITKLKRARPAVVFHTGYNPDITLFMRQAREQGLRWKALVGHGAGHSQYDKLEATFGKDADLLFTVDPAPAQLMDRSKLKPGLGELIDFMVKGYKAEKNVDQLPPHVSMGFNNSWIFLTDVLPRAIKKYGGWDAEALRKAALETDIPEGGTMQGYGVKFPAPGDPLAGQNQRAFPVVLQFVSGKTNIVWPASVQSAEPVLPLPTSNPYAAK
jgi:branched-chain amino acid transport system substrate-binding protein